MSCPKAQGRCFIAALAAALSCHGVAHAADVSSADPRLREARRWGWFGSVENIGRVIAVDHYGPRDDFNDAFRDIDIGTVSVMRSWSTSSDFELQLGAGILLANGTRWEPLEAEPPRDSDAFGVTFGGLIRYNLPELLSVRPFVDASAQMLWAEQPFPVGGSAVNGFLRWGGGVAIPLGSHSFEVGYRLAHISNGGANSVSNPAWSGDGLFVAWRKRIR